MTSFARFLVLLCLSVFVGCAPDPHQIVITEEDASNLLDVLDDQEGLTVEEVRLLVGRQVRAEAVDALGGEAASIVGRTVGELIAEERTFQEEAELRRQEEERLAAEARARDEALAAELRDAILLAVSSKDFIPSNARAGRYSDYLTFRVAYENTSGRDIRAFRGRVRFTDLFGDEIYAFGITIQDPIVSGAHGTWDGQIDYNEFVDDHVRVRQTDLDDMRVEWLPSGVIFADGTQLGEVPDR